MLGTTYAWNNLCLEQLMLGTTYVSWFYNAFGLITSQLRDFLMIKYVLLYNLLYIMYYL